MNSKTTWRLFFVAIALFAYIWLFERRTAPPGSADKPRIFPKLAANAVTALDVQSSNLVLRAERTNDAWRLIRPFYPAQSTAIQSFVEKLASLPQEDVIRASEVSAQPGKLKDYGLDPPVAVFTVSQGSNRFLLHVGAATPLRDQLYAMVPGSGEVLVTDSSILKALPASVNEWRSPMLVQMEGRPFDHLQIRSGQRQLEFERDTTNQIWRISKPTPARANNQRIAELLQTLNTARVKEFVTDSLAADLERFGLQTPELELAYTLDTNRVTALEFGASPTNDPSSVYVRRLSTTNIVLASRELVDLLSLPAKAYHDPRLISIDPNQITMIQVKGPRPFTLARQTNALWMITEPAPMAGDLGLVKAFMTNLVEMTIENFAKDVPTDADLKQFGLTPPQISYALFSTLTNASGAATNALTTQLDFGGSNGEGMVYARRNDETPVYLTLDVSYLLPKAPWQLRERQIFNFAPTNVVAVTMASAAGTNRVARQGGVWSADPIRNPIVEEAVFRLGRLQAQNWVDRGTQSMAARGFRADGLNISLQMAPGSPVTPAPIWFGKQAVRNNVYAATVLPGDNDWTIFEFPGELFVTLRNTFGTQ